MFGFRFRIFAGRIGDGLYLATQPFIFNNLMKRDENKSDIVQQRTADTSAHMLVRLRPKNWDRILDDYRLGWAEGNRHSCLNNMGPLSGLARAYDLPASQLIDVASKLYGVRYFCPDGGEYQRISEDSGLASDGPRGVCCTIHGSAAAPRQQQAPAPGSRLDRLITEFKGMTAALTFTEEGLRAVLRIDRKMAEQ